MREVISRREMLCNMVSWGGLAISVSVPSSIHAAALADDAAKAEQRYEEAVAFLKHGRWLNLCATKLKGLSASSPQDVRYHVALGYAYASRCASLCYSLGSTPKTPASEQEIQRHLDFMRALRAMAKSGQAGKQNAPSVELPEIPAEPAPSGIFTFVTIDDSKSVTMTREEFAVSLRRGFEDTSSCWKAAVESAVGEEQMRDSIEAQIWGLQLFQFVAKYSVTESLPVAFSKEEQKKWREEAIKLAEQLVQLSPDNPQYLLLLAEVSLQPYSDTWSHADESVLAIYQKAIKQGADDPAVRYRAYQVCLNMKPQRLDEAGRLIREIAADQRGNAYAQYRLAGYIARYEMYRKPSQKGPEQTREATTKLVSVVTSGTSLASFKPLDKCVSPPSLLKSPFALLGQVWGNSSRMVDMLEGPTVAAVLSKYAQSTAEKDVFFAKRCCYAIIGMGKRLGKPMPTAGGAISDADPSHQSREIAGEIVLSQGYSVLSEILKARGDETEYNKIASERKEFIAHKQQRYIERLKQSAGHR